MVCLSPGISFLEADVYHGAPYDTLIYLPARVILVLYIFQIVDFGSAECRIARFLTQIPSAVDISLVDIDRNLLEQSKWCIRPMTCDYIIKREKPLSVKILEGSVIQFDSRLGKCDAVTMVEV